MDDDIVWTSRMSLGSMRLDRVTGVLLFSQRGEKGAVVDMEVCTGC
jgi:hypothetical protein